MEEKTTTTWYCITSYRSDIRPVEVVKETEKTVTLQETDWRGLPRERRARKDGYDRFFPTWEEAHSVMLERSERKLTSAKEAVQAAEARLKEVKALTKPQ